MNVEGTRIVLEAAVQAGCERFIHLSTVSAHAVEGHEVVNEATPLRQAGDAYGESKALAEQAVWAAAAQGLQATVLRPPAILGWPLPPTGPCAWPPGLLLETSPCRAMALPPCPTSTWTT